MIGDYRILGRLGGGAMAELFLAHKMSPFGFVRRAVVKRVRSSRPDYAQLQNMLIDEARATACFDHPNLVSLFDVGETQGGVYLALEYVEGCDLRRVNATLRARKEALPFELAAFITTEVLRGLHHAHTVEDEEGCLLDVIHRDVNPSNILISRSGHIKLADFGVVRMRGRVQPQTEPGFVKGKYAYLAPEYIAGEPCSIQTDVYAAGIMLFELLSGRECFGGKTAYEVMWKIVNKGVPMYRLDREGVPEDLQRIVQRATSMAPERRYLTAQDMANAVEAWLTRSGRHATPWVLSVFFNRHDLLPPRGQLETTLTPLGPNELDGFASEDTARTPLPQGMLAHASLTAPQALLEDPLPDKSKILDAPEATSDAANTEFSPPRFPPTTEADANRTTEAASVSPQISSQNLPETKENPFSSTHPPQSGKMEEIPGVDLLESLAKAKHSGVVEFKCGLIWKKVRLFEGKPVGVTSNMGMELIGEHLVKSKIITREQLDYALQSSERKGKSLTVTLIDEGALQRSTLEDELGKNLATRLHEVLEWRWGTFELKAEDPVEPVDFMPRLDFQELLQKARDARENTKVSEPEDEQDPFDPQTNLEKAIGLARSIESARGRGQIERPWRPDDSSS